MLISPKEQVNMTFVTKNNAKFFEVERYSSGRVRLSMSLSQCSYFQLFVHILDAVSKFTEAEKPGAADLVGAGARLGRRLYQDTGAGGLHVPGPREKQFQ